MRTYQTVFALLLIAALGFTSCNKDTKELEAQIAKLEQLLSTAQTDLSDLRNEYNSKVDFKALEADLQKISGEIAKLRQDYENIGTTTTDLSAIENSIADILKRLNKLETTPSPDTPTDLSEIETSIADILKRLTDLESTSSSTPSDIRGIENSITNILNRLTDLEGTPTSSTPTDLSTVTDALDAIRKDIKKINETLPPSFNQSTFDAILARIDDLEKQTEKITPLTKGKENNYEWVDLGTGVLWATCNIGAKNNKPEDYGNYYAWGEIKPMQNDWTTYKFDGDNKKYTTSDKLTELEDKDDIARQEWKGSWRIPTQEDFQALDKCCTSKWTTLNGVYGRQFTSLLTDQSIFLPAAGFRYDGKNISFTTSHGNYWSRSLYTTDADYAYCLNFDAIEVNTISNGSRGLGFSIRPVCSRLTE